MKHTSVGFYKELEELHAQGLSEANFGFLENVDVGDYFHLYDFLHGHCDEFAAALSDYYGYPIEYIVDSSNVLVHAYCTAEFNGVKAYIDARGITTDSELFFNEFADFCTYEKESGRFYDLKGECQVLRHKNTFEMYAEDNREPNQDQDLLTFFKENNSYYDIKNFERVIDMNSSKILYVLTARSWWNKDPSQHTSFIDESFPTFQEAMDQCRKFQRDLASHMRAGIEEVRVAPGEKPVKTGFYWELVRGNFERISNMNYLQNDYTVKQSVLNCKNIETAIRRAQTELMKQEMHENFGQEYVRAIKDKFKVGLSYTLEDKMNMAALNHFDHWCSTYVPNKEKPGVNQSKDR